MVLYQGDGNVFRYKSINENISTKDRRESLVCAVVWTNDNENQPEPDRVRQSKRQRAGRVISGVVFAEFAGSRAVSEVAEDWPQASMSKPFDRAEISAAKLVGNTEFMLRRIRAFNSSPPGPLSMTTKTVFVVTSPSLSPATRPMVLVTALLALP